MSDFIELVVSTYEKLMEEFRTRSRFLEFVNPDSPFEVPPDCDDLTLKKRLSEFKQMIYQKVTPANEAEILSRLRAEVLRLRSVNQDALTLVKIAPVVRGCLDKIDLNWIRRCRLICSIARQRTTAAAGKYPVLVEQAIADIYDAMAASGLNNCLFDHLKVFLQSTKDETKSRLAAVGVNESTTFAKNWNENITTDINTQAEAGQKIAGAILTLGLIGYDHDLSENEKFVQFWYPFVDIIVGLSLLRKA